MRAVLLAIVLSGALISGASACRLPDNADVRELQRKDIAHQRELVVELRAEAELIFVGRYRRTEGSEALAEFDVVEVLKGEASEAVRLPYDSEIKVGCFASDGFGNALLELNALHIVYVVNGKLERSAGKRRNREQISFREERRILRRRAQRVRKSAGRLALAVSARKSRLGGREEPAYEWRQIEGLRKCDRTTQSIGLVARVFVKSTFLQARKVTSST